MQVANRSCCQPAPDRSGRSCDKPSGHDGPHWTYGGNTMTWPKEQNEQAWEDLRADGGLPESHAEVVHLCAYAHCKGHERPDESCVP